MIVTFPIYNTNSSTVQFNTNLIGKYRFKLMYYSLGRRLANEGIYIQRVQSNKLFSGILTEGKCIYLNAREYPLITYADFPEFDVELVDGVVDFTFSEATGGAFTPFTVSSIQGGVITFSVQKIDNKL